MRVDWLLEDGVSPIAKDGGIWPTGATYSYVGIGRTFDRNTIAGAGSAPNATFYVKAQNAGTSADVVGFVGNAVATRSGTTVFGANLLARAERGVVAKLVGLEIDIQPASGATVASGSGGLYINSFSEPLAGAAIQTGAIDGGRFGNGVVLYGISTSGAGLAAGAGEQMGALINTTAGARYSQDAIIVNEAHKIRLAEARVYGEGRTVVVDGAIREISSAPPHRHRHRVMLGSEHGTPILSIGASVRTFGSAQP